jgi:hypothetical protein
VAVGGVGRPRHRVRDLIGCAGDVPDCQPAAGREDPVSLGIQPALVGDVHLDVLAEDSVKRAVGEREVGDVTLGDGDPVAYARGRVEPAGGVAVLVGQVDAGHGASVFGGQESRGAADAGAGVQHPLVPGDSGELGGG